MKGDFTRDTFDPAKGYNRVAKQQGRVDLDADFNEQAEILVHRDRVEATDVIGQAGVPKHAPGFQIAGSGTGLTYGPGRIYVDGLLCEAPGPGPVPLGSQIGYTLPTQAGSYIAYIDIWDRYVSAIEDPAIKEIALGGPDTAGRVQTAFQVKLLRIDNPPPFDALVCVPFPAPPADGALSARTDPGKPPENPCVVGEAGGYRGLENRLYRVEVHDDGRDANGALVRPVTFKWSRDNGSVLLEVAPDGIDNDQVKVLTLGPDTILTVGIGDWVELTSEENEWQCSRGLMARVVDIDPGDGDFPVLSLDRSAAAFAGKNLLKVRRWDQKDASAVALADGAVPLQTAFYELEDGVQVRFDPGLTYRTGDYWQIPARTRTGTLEWPASSVWVPRQGVQHHYATLAMAAFDGSQWRVRDCRKPFDPLTEIDDGDCCIEVRPGESIQAALDLVIAAGGGCVELCGGLHRLEAPLRIESAANVTLKGCGDQSRVLYRGGRLESAAISVRSSQDIEFRDFFILAEGVRSVIAVIGDGGSREIRLERLTVINTAFGNEKDEEAIQAAAVRAPGIDGLSVRRCRLAASVALSLPFGDALPALPSLAEALRGALAGLAFRDFSGLDDRPRYGVGDSDSDQGVTVTYGPFVWANGQTTANGHANPVAISNGVGMSLNNITAAFASATPFQAAAVAFAFQGGNLNLRVNGQLRNVNAPAQLDGIQLGGAEVSVNLGAADGRTGILLVRSTAPITEFAFGGQELRLSGFALAGTTAGTPERGDFGGPARRVEVRESTLRFTGAGVLAMALYDSELRESRLWAIGERSAGIGNASRNEAMLGRRLFAADGETGAAAGDDAAQRLALRLEQYADALFAQPPAIRSGLALGAWLLEKVSLVDCDLAAGSGVFALLQGNVLLRGGTIAARQHAFFAAYLHDSRLESARLESRAGNGVLLGAVSRVQLEGLSIVAREGVGNAGLAASSAAAAHLLRFLCAAGYGVRDEASMRGILWLLLEATFDWAGLRAWLDALDALLARSIPGFAWPAAAVLAMSLEQALRGGKLGGSAAGAAATGLTVLDLEIDDLDITAKADAIRFNGFFPLGGLRVEGCTLNSEEGRGVELLANAYAAHMELFEQALFFALAGLETVFSKQPAPALADLYRAIAESIREWQASARRRFSSETSVKGNTIQSRRTGIDTNLFQARIADNHVTLPERAGLARRAAPARVYGVVMAVTGAPLPGATVYLPEAGASALSDAQGSFQVAGLAPGAYTPVVTAPGYLAQTLAPVTLATGEAKELRVTLSAAGVAGWSYGLGNFNADAGAAYVGAYRNLGAALSNRAAHGLIETLETSDGFLEMADVLRDSSYIEPEDAAARIVAYANRGAEQRRELAQALGRLQGQWGDTGIESAGAAFQSALQSGQGSLAEPAAAWVEALLGLVDSRGILVRAPGCAIEDNRVTVRRDERGDTEAVGGIQVTVSYKKLLALLLLDLYLEYLAERNGGDADAKFDAKDLMTRLLARIPGTGIHRNEVGGGIGHGIALFGSRREPELLRQVAILDNRVDGCASAGIHLNASALVLDLSVQRNAVTRCGDGRGFSQAKGGIALNGAAAVSVNDNTVTYCAVESDVQAFGIDLEGLLGLSLQRNVVLANGGRKGSSADGGVRLSNIGATVQVLGNTIENNRGMGLLWEGAGNGKALVHAALAQGAKAQLGLGGAVESPRAVFSGNAVGEGPEGLSPALRIRDLESLAMNGNTLRGTGMAAQVVNVRRLAAGLNQIEVDGKIAALIANVQQGVVEGNVSNAPIDIQNSPVLHVNNVPPTV